MKSILVKKACQILIGFFIVLFCDCKTHRYISDAEYQKQIDRWEKQYNEGRLSNSDYIYLVLGYKELHQKK